MAHALAVLLAVAGLAIFPAAEPQYSAELLFPQESWHNHSSSIVELPNQGLLVCWFHGSGERNADDVKILGARKRKGETQWSTPFVMADTPDYPDTNCAMFIDPQGRLWLMWPTILAAAPPNTPDTHQQTPLAWVRTATPTNKSADQLCGNSTVRVGFWEGVSAAIQTIAAIAEATPTMTLIGGLSSGFEACGSGGPGS